MAVTGRDSHSGVRRQRVQAARVIPSGGAETTVSPSVSSSTRWLSQPRGRHPWSGAYRTRIFLLDTAVGVLALAVANVVTFGRDVPTSYLAVSAMIVLAWLAALLLAGGYEIRRLGISDDEYRAVSRAFSGVLGIFALGALLAQWTVRPLFLLVVLLLLPCAGLAGRFVARGWLRRNRRRGLLNQRTIVVGRADSATALINSIRADHQQGLTPVAACVSGMSSAPDDVTDLAGVPVLGKPADTLTAVDLADAEVVAIAADPDLSGVALRRLTWALAERNVELIVAPGLLDVAGPRFHLRPSTDLTLLHVEPPEPSVATQVIKGISDRALAGILLLLLAPLLIVTAIGIKLTSPGPVFFRQRRVGVHGEPFLIYKFRTMIVGAHRQVEELRQASEGNSVLFKLRDDPRVTRIGRHLRRYSVDELPQLINVLMGHMSLVGPRPSTPEEVDKFELDAVRRLRVRPGMTGLWQVSGRSDLTFDEMVLLDIYYAEN